MDEEPWARYSRPGRSDERVVCSRYGFAPDGLRKSPMICIRAT
jgi:hypothetical protein